jgi:hypothetical protein
MREKTKENENGENEWKRDGERWKSERIWGVRDFRDLLFFLKKKKLKLIIKFVRFT